MHVGDRLMMRSRKTVLIASGLTVFAIAGAVLLYSGLRRGEAAQASPAAELFSELPAGAPTLVYADLAAIRASSFYKRRPDHGPIAMPDRDYADFVQSTGFNFEKDLDRVAMAAWPLEPGQEKNKPSEQKIILVAEGRFDQRKIRDYATRKGKIDRQQGHDVFQFSNTARPGVSSLTFLNDHRVAIVEGPSIAQLLEHRGESSASDPARQRAARVEGAAVFVITRAPTVPGNSSPGGAQASQLLSMAKSVQWITLAARPEGDNLRLSLEGECLTATDARQLQSALQLLRMLGQAGLESPKTRKSMDPATLGVAETLLKSADVSATAERVRILVELTPDILKLGGARAVH
jgi:hypothetical protein